MTNESLLKAGSILLADAGSLGNTPTTPQEVRSYRHAVLGDRVVARVGASELAAATDATMEFLGFDAPSTSGPIGIATRSALGFPGSALIADPGNARYALGVVKDLNRLARMAGSRAGAAKEGMDALATTLAQSVPQFLPSYFEQCGRIFIAVDNTSYAGAMFTKARSAEATYGLPVNEEQRRTVFLEFAFAGALPAKALDEYAKTLINAYAPAEAFEHFNMLALQRTRGGLAPWAQLMDVLKRMAKAASKDVEQAQRDMLDALFSSPSLRFASQTFWQSIRSVIINMAKESPAIRGALLNLHPAGSYADWWIELLSDTGATVPLFRPIGDCHPDELPTGGKAAWLNRLITDRGTQLSRFSDLLTQMAPMLIAEQTPVQFHHFWNLNVDQLDLALELGVPCAPPDHLWFRYNLAETGTRPLTYLANDPTLRTWVKHSVEPVIESHQARAIFTREGLRPFLVDWLAARVEAISPRKAIENPNENENNSSGVSGMVTAVAELVSNATPAMLDLLPDARERLGAPATTGALRSQLRAGLFEEYAWPAFESAVRALTGGQPIRDSVIVFEAWPNVILHNDRRAMVVGHDGVLLEHDLRWDQAAVQKGLTFVDGVLFVAWGHWGQPSKGYWTNDPTNVLEHEGITFRHNYYFMPPSVPLPNGGVTYGGKPFRVGDVVRPEPERVCTDGLHYWKTEFSREATESGHQMVEFDPQSGARGRRSWPSFVEENLADNVKFLSAQLLPATADLIRSPLGVKHDLLGYLSMERRESVGFDRTQNRTQNTVVVRIDGVRAELSGELFRQTVTLIDWPAADRRYLVSEHGRITDPQSGTVVSEQAMPFGIPVSIPLIFWHHFMPRDVDGSTVLRNTSNEQADRLMEIVRDVMKGNGPANALDPEAVLKEHVARLGEVLTGVSDAQLLGAIGVASNSLLVAVEQLRGWLDDSHTEGFDPSTISEEAEATTSAATRAWLHHDHSARLLTQLGLLKSFVGAKGVADTAYELRDYRLHQALFSGATSRLLMRAVPLLAYRALLPGTPVAERTAIVNYLREWTNHPIARHDSLTLLKLRRNGHYDDGGMLRWGPDGSPWWICIREVEIDGDLSEIGLKLTGVAFAPNAPPPTGLIEVDRQSIEPLVSNERVLELLALIETHGPLAAFSASHAQRLSEQTGMSTAMAAVVLSGFLGVGYGATPFGREQRDQFGVKASDVKAALSELDHDMMDRAEVLIPACYPERLESIWERDLDAFVDDVARGWAAVFGAGVVLPDDLLAAVTKLVGEGWGWPRASEVLGAIEGSEPRWTQDVPVTFNRYGTIANDVLNTGWCQAMWRSFAAIAHDLPVGDVWRSYAARSATTLAQQLAQENSILAWSSCTEEDEHRFALIKDLPTLQMPADENGHHDVTVYDAGAVIVSTAHIMNGLPSIWHFFLRTRRFEEESVMRTVADSFVNPNDGFAPLMKWFVTERAHTFFASLARPTIAEGSWEQNPLLSVPQLTSEVASSLELSSDAAALYLQLLALPEPTTTNLRKWNNWTPKKINSVAGPLVVRGLLVEATRTGSGRDYFLPGGWLEMRSPAIGIESWKRDLFLISHEPGGKQRSFLGRVLPLDPIPMLFRKAWERYQSGDKPGFVAAGLGLGERKTKASKK
jgi:hypothetical protein